MGWIQYSTTLPPLPSSPPGKTLHYPPVSYDPLKHAPVKVLVREQVVGKWDWQDCKWRLGSGVSVTVWIESSDSMDCYLVWQGGLKVVLGRL